MPVAMSLLLFLHHVSLLLACRAACPSTTQTLEIIVSRVCIFSASAPEITGHITSLASRADA